MFLLCHLVDHCTNEFCLDITRLGKESEGDPFVLSSDVNRSEADPLSSYFDSLRSETVLVACRGIASGISHYLRG